MNGSLNELLYSLWSQHGFSPMNFREQIKGDRPVGRLHAWSCQPFPQFRSSIDKGSCIALWKAPGILLLGIGDVRSKALVQFQKIEAPGNISNFRIEMVMLFAELRKLSRKAHSVIGAFEQFVDEIASFGPSDN